MDWIFSLGKFHLSNMWSLDGLQNKVPLTEQHFKKRQAIVSNDKPLIIGYPLLAIQFTSVKK